MRYGRRFTMPIDPWPRASLGERLSITVALSLLLVVPIIAAGVGLVLAAALVSHVYRSFDLGATLRAAIDRRRFRAAALVVPVAHPRAEIGGASRRTPTIGPVAGIIVD